MGTGNSPKKSPRDLSHQEESTTEIRHGEQAMPPKPARRTEPRHYDDEFDLVARIRAARERAEREMRKFGKPSEYIVRRVQGQRKDLNYDEMPIDEETPSGEPKDKAHKTDSGEEE